MKINLRFRTVHCINIEIGMEEKNIAMLTVMYYPLESNVKNRYVIFLVESCNFILFF